jgi:hypothetical protein
LGRFDDGVRDGGFDVRVHNMVDEGCIIERSAAAIDLGRSFILFVVLVDVESIDSGKGSRECFCERILSWKGLFGRFREDWNLNGYGAERCL